SFRLNVTFFKGKSHAMACDSTACQPLLEMSVVGLQGDWSLTCQKPPQGASYCSMLWQCPRCTIVSAAGANLTATAASLNAWTSQILWSFAGTAHDGSASVMEGALTPANRTVFRGYPF